MDRFAPPYKTWLEISRNAVRNNVRVFKRLITKPTRLWAVVKSNAYGHGLITFSKLADQYGVDGFCVDSVVEGMKLSKNGIRKPILALGYTLPHLYKTARQHDITVTISNFEALSALQAVPNPPDFHLKIDTGMHRQGFYPNDLPRIIRRFRIQDSGFKNLLTGIYTHFAAAKDQSDQAFTKKQFAAFQKSVAVVEDAGFKNILKHAAGTGGTLLGQSYHGDAVRVGIGLYGIWPSLELEQQLGKKIKFKPVMRWRAIISEIKTVSRGAGIGYDLTERVKKDARIAVVPIGYWHGVPRALSSVGCVWIGERRARRAKILGRVSMDMLVVDVTRISCRVGTVVEIRPLEIARVLNASPYEILTRINPLMYKKII